MNNNCFEWQTTGLAVSLSLCVQICCCCCYCIWMVGNARDGQFRMMTFYYKVYLCCIVVDLDLDWEVATIDLISPLVSPCSRADILVDALEILARLVIGTTDLLTPVEIDERLVTVTCLIHVWEPWVERSGPQLVTFLCNFLRHLWIDSNGTAVEFSQIMFYIYL